MYLKHWGMAHRPFDSSHSPKFFVPVESAMLALTKIRYAVSMGLGCASICGVAGSGKTEVLRMAMRDFANNGWGCSYLPNPSGPRDEVFLQVLHSLNGNEKGFPSALEALLVRLQELGNRGGRVLLVIDEAQSVRDIELLDELRMLLNVEESGVPVVSMVLSGQPGLEKKLLQAGHFDARVALKIKCIPYDAQQTQTYILARMKASGCTRGIFTQRAAQMVYEASGGLPGNINRLCELCLITAFSKGEDRVKPEVVRVCANELGLKGDLAVERIHDEIWSDELPPIKNVQDAGEDILAELSQEGF